MTQLTQENSSETTLVAVVQPVAIVGLVKGVRMPANTVFNTTVEQVEEAAAWVARRTAHHTESTQRF